MTSLKIDHHLISICNDILRKTALIGEDGWVWNEDEFQRGYFSGGYCPEGDLGVGFYFSYYAPDGNDYIFYMSFDDVRSVLRGDNFDPPLEYWKRSPLGPY